MQPTDDTTYDLAELADLADVSPRTVRYYIQQGLLPSPGARGPGARYDRAHLDRLRLIRRLQREHLPLAEIRRRLEELDAESVRALAEAPASYRPGSSALEYVQRLLAGEARPSGVAPARSLRATLQAQQDATRVAPPAPPQAVPDRSQWERITLAPDVELHVRRPLSRGENKLVERLIEAARTIFRQEGP
ncbi:MAG TPA: MerR family transcriptional regulator [Gemmatimonadaceae bacterium]|nr:MerR family transcriptional regulator [Gemmatimonadaceae bacterium]